MGASSGSSRVFQWFSQMSSVTGMINWMGICITLIRFRKGLKVRSQTFPRRCTIEIIFSGPWNRSLYFTVLQPTTTIHCMVVFMVSDPNYLPLPLASIFIQLGYPYHPLRRLAGVS